MSSAGIGKVADSHEFPWDPTTRQGVAGPTFTGTGGILGAATHRLGITDSDTTLWGSFDDLGALPAGQADGQSSSAKLREKNRVAQIRYRARRKEREAASEQAVEELSKRLEELQAHNHALESRERLITQLVQAQELHLDKLGRHQVVQRLVQSLLMEEVLEMMSKVYGRDVPQEEAISWSMESWMNEHFPRYLDHLAKLRPAAQQNLRGPEAQELTQLVTKRRELETKHALFSNLHLALFAWNLDHGRHIPVHLRPSRATWAAIVAQLALTQEQQEAMLKARQRLLKRLAQASEQRLAAYSALGFDLASMPRDQVCKGRGAAQLHVALDRERQSVVDFLTVVTAETLTPLQEAWLDAESSVRPWWPDVFAMCDALALQHGQPAAPAFPVLVDVPSAELRELVMPMFTPFQLLITPCTALGAGSQLKRAMLHCHCQTTGQVSPTGLYYELPSIQSMEGHTLSETTVGKYRQHWRNAAMLPRYGRLDFCY